jgi:glycosyltransferase involved in cell wall biosynthesis
MSDSPLLSVILPVYNAEEHLRECFESVLSQPVGDREILVIDDGSTDGSRQIIDEYAKKGSDIKVVSQENRGVSAARNAGIKQARGKWLSFLDADDFYEPDALSGALTRAEEIGCDLLLCTYYQYDDMSDLKRAVDQHFSDTRLPARLEEPFSYRDVSDTFFQLISPTVSAKIWRRDFVIKSGLAFDEGLKHGEDQVFSSLGSALAEKIATYRKPLFSYRKFWGGNSVPEREQFDPLNVEYQFRFKDAIEKLGVLDALRKSYTNKILQEVKLQITYLDNLTEYRKLAAYYREIGFDGLDVTKEAADEYLDPGPMRIYDAITSGDVPPFALSRIGRLYDKVERLQEKNAALKEKNHALREKNRAYKERNLVYKERIHAFRERNQVLREKNDALTRRIKHIESRPLYRAYARISKLLRRT